MTVTNGEQSEGGPSLKIAFINARGVMNRVDRINSYWIQHPDVKVMILVETWLKPGTPAPRFADATIAVDERCATIGSRGTGGLLIFVRYGLNFIVHREDPHLSIISVGQLRIAGCYFPPYYGEVSQELEKKMRQLWKIIEGEALMNPNTIVMGDFNAHGLARDKVNTRGTWMKEQLIDSSLERVQPIKGTWTTINSTGMGINDHTFTNKFTALKVQLIVDQNESFGGSDHRLLELEIAGLPAPDDTVVERFKLRKINEKKEDLCAAIKEHLPSASYIAQQPKQWISSEHVTTLTDRATVVDALWNKIFHSIVNNVVKVLGKYRVKPMERRNFLTTKMEEKRKEWDEAIKIAQKATTDKAPRAQLKILWRKVGDLSKWWNKRVQRRRTVVFTKIIDTLHSDTPEFQKMISCIKKKEQRNMGKCQLNAKDMLTHSQYFTSTFGTNPTGQEEQVDHALLDRTDPAGNFTIRPRQPFTEQDTVRLTKLLRHLPNGKAAGDDQTPGEIWKAIASDEAIVQVLLTFFHLCQTLATTPTAWKIALIVPIYKQKGDVLNIANYRPIALTQVIRRVFEQYNLPLLEAAEDRFNPTQGGFRKLRATLDQILIVSEFLTRFRINAVIYLDIKAAYDTVDRRILWTKMKDKFGFPEETIRIIRELFDSNVTQLVIKGEKSDNIAILRGLLQGSSLSPLLFNIFINSLLDELHKLPKQRIADCLLINNAFFADDGALLVTNNTDAATLMTTTYAWSLQNGMQFAIPKCKFVGTPGYNWHITMNGLPIERVDDYKYLGVYNNCDGINWEKSTHHRIVKFKGMAQFLNRKGLNPTGWRLQQRLTAYKSFLRPMLEYGMALSILPKSITNMIQQAQNYVLRLMLRGSKNTATASLHILLDLETIATRNIELNARYFNSLLNSTKADHPAGTLTRHIYATNRVTSRSLVSIFKKISPYAGAVYGNKLPSLDDLKKLRIDHLETYRQAQSHTHSSRLHPPQGSNRNNLVREGWKLPRSTVNAIIDFKMNKLPRVDCLICNGQISLGHLLNCGTLERLCQTITTKYELEMSHVPISISHHADKLLWWLDDQLKPNMNIYKDVGEAILRAKKTIIATERDSPLIYSDDEDPDEHYTAQLIATGSTKGFAQAPNPEDPHADKKSHDDPIAWVRGADLQTLQTHQATISTLATDAPPAQDDTDKHISRSTVTTGTEEPQTATTGEPYAPLKLSLAILYRGLFNWPPGLRQNSINSFINDSAYLRPQRQTLYSQFMTHMRIGTLWTTPDGIKALELWLEAFRFWNLPPSLREDIEPILYCRDLPQAQYPDCDDTICALRTNLLQCLEDTEDRLRCWQAYTYIKNKERD